MEDLADLAKAFIHLPPQKGPNVGVVTFTGGWGALGADVCQEYGRQLFIQNLPKLL